MYKMMKKEGVSEKVENNINKAFERFAQVRPTIATEVQASGIHDMLIDFTQEVKELGQPRRGLRLDECKVKVFGKILPSASECIEAGYEDLAEFCTYISTNVALAFNTYADYLRDKLKCMGSIDSINGMIKKLEHLVYIDNVISYSDEAFDMYLGILRQAMMAVTYDKNMTCLMLIENENKDLIMRLLDYGWVRVYINENRSLMAYGYTRPYDRYHNYIMSM